MQNSSEKEIYSFKAIDIKGHEHPMANFKGHTLLIVNVASHCGFTPQYEGLQELFKKYQSKGLIVLGFPCNQFGKQEPGTGQEIEQFCQLNFKVNFPLFEKVEVNGENASPLFQYLKRAMPGLLGSQAIKWNFTKFLIDAEGNPIKRYAPTDTPEKIEKDLKEYLP